MPGRRRARSRAAALRNRRVEADRMKHWRIEQVAWDRFDPAKVDPEVVPLVKAAAMVERNGDDYALYLKRVFADDPDFQRASDAWAEEEVQHGDALGRWATLADPGWDYARRLRALPRGLQDRHQRRRLHPRQPHRRADRALHGGDRDQQLLHGARRRDGGAGAEAGLPPDRGRRVPALQALLRPHEALPGARGAFLPEAAARRGRAHRRVRGRRARLRLPLLQRGARHALRPRPLHRRLHGPAPWASTASGTSSAAWA